MEHQQTSKADNQSKEDVASARPVSSDRAPSHPIHQLRGALGNRAFGKFIQAKLEVSQPGDAYEQEADRVADTIMRMADDSRGDTVAISEKRPEPHIQRECLECQAEEQENLGQVQRKEAEGQTGGSEAGMSTVESPVESLNGNGQPLATSARAFFEPRFGYDFSQVRVHTDAQAAASARAFHAVAYTSGNDLVFGTGQYAPENTEGRKLLAHELTHVVQQAQPRQTSAATSEQKLQRKSDVLQSELYKSTCGSGCGDKSDLKLDGVAGDATDPLLIDGPAPPQMAVRSNVSTPALFRQALPPPNSVRVVQNHQVPITAAHVAAGWRSGFGGVSEIEVSNGTTDYDGSNISEHFIGGLGSNAQIGGCANQSGQGGQGGSTFTVGTGVNFSQNGLTLNFPPKHNTFYDVHIKGGTANFLPAGTNFDFSLCVQRYSFGGNTIWGRLGGLLPAIFFRVHTLTRANVGGQDVAQIDLNKF